MVGFIGYVSPWPPLPTPPPPPKKKIEPCLEEDISAHGEAMSDDGLGVRVPSAIPAVQLHAAAARQQNLPVYLHWGTASQLVACAMGTNTTSQVKEITLTSVYISVVTLQIYFTALLENAPFFSIARLFKAQDPMEFQTIIKVFLYRESITKWKAV